ncbi:MAG: TIM44-like domain-containing protein [Thermodesulfobacteriota bacterium]
MDRQLGKMGRRIWANLAVMLLFLLPPALSWARVGGGCLAEGTPVLTPEGAIPIEKLKVGDGVLSIAAGKAQLGRVLTRMEVQSDELLEVTIPGAKLRITSEHPVMVNQGEYLLAKLLKSGDPIYVVKKAHLALTAVQSIRPIRENQLAYNLLVSPGGTFAAAGIVVHNKGCFLPDSPILKADGTEVPIRTIRPGDRVMAFTPEGVLVRTTVRNIVQREVDEFVVLQTDRQTLRVTPEHPFYIGHGQFKTLEALKVGDVIWAWDGQLLAEQPILGLETIRERTPVYNLQTDLPNTFFASRFAVHNKGGGCFPAGTLIRTPQGQTPIETLTPRNAVLAMDPQSRIVKAEVDELLVTRSRILRIETDCGVLRTTTEHPLRRLEGEFARAGELKAGDRVLAWFRGTLIPATVLRSTFEMQEQQVYNLRTTWPNTFLAGDFVAHNKGGGSFHSSSSRRGYSGGRSGGGSSSEEQMIGLITFVGIATFLVIFLVILKRASYQKRENLDFVYSSAAVSPKAMKTEKLLDFLSRQDPSLSPQELRKLAEATFRKLQECWQARAYEPMEPLLMSALFSQHKAQLDGLKRNHEINRIENLQVERVDLVNVRYTEKPAQREFTALVTASARDYYVDERNGKFLRGDRSPARFQEFWTFHRWGDQWRLREIEQAGESDLLKEENFVEMLTDQAIQEIYGEAAGKRGTAGPWLETTTEEKATRIDRMLNFLVQTDRLWNRQQMLERARQIFLRVFLAEESGNPAQVPVADLFPGPAAALKNRIRQQQASGVTVEYRNLCVRKAELILVRNFADRTKDEFTVRVSAHAQKFVRQGDRVMREQPYVTPFEEYWTLGRLDEQWKLKEVMSPARGQKLIAEENVDEDSSPEQLKWYYGHPRAN